MNLTEQGLIKGLRPPEKSKHWINQKVFLNTEKMSFSAQLYLVLLRKRISGKKLHELSLHFFAKC